MYIGDLSFDQVGTYLVDFVSYLAICSTRLFVLSLIFPPLSGEVIQGVIRNGIVTLFGFYIMYGQPVASMHALTGIVVVSVVVSEAGIGFVLGFVASRLFWIAEAAGTYIDDIAGYNNAQMTNPFGSGQSTPVATLVGQIAITTFWVAGGMLTLITVLFTSYEWWPIGGTGLFSGQAMNELAANTLGSLMEAIAKLAAPMIFILVLVDVSVGYLMAAAPKLDLGTIAQSIKATLALLVLVLALSIFISTIRTELLMTGLGGNVKHWIHGGSVTGHTD